MKKAILLSFLLVFGSGCADIMNNFLGELPKAESPSPDLVGPTDKPLIEAKASSGAAWLKASGQYSSVVNTQYHRYQLKAPGAAAMKVSISSGAIKR